MVEFDDTDARILALLQEDASLTVDQISDRAALSRNACWRRIKAMEDRGVIRGRVVLADPAKVGCPLHVIVHIRTNSHQADWLERFQRAISAMPQIVSAYRMTGELDYLLRVRVADMAAYDHFYKTLIGRIPVSDISASFVMEEIKDTTALPL